VFDQRWKNFQFAILAPGDNGLTSIRNANQAEIRGMETNVTWKATDNLEISSGAAFYDAKLNAVYCGFTDAAGNPVTDCPVGTVNPIDGTPEPEAPKGAQLPVTPKFKANLVARYNFTVGGMDAYLQGAAVHVGRRASDLRTQERDLKGDLPSYTSVDFSFGIRKNQWAIDAFLENAFDSRGQVSRFAECTETVCAAHGVDPTHPNGQVYVVPIQPRTFGLRFTQDFN
jgi:outer membrane receptor protein involved in Fe transport